MFPTFIIPLDNFSIARTATTTTTTTTTTITTVDVFFYLYRFELGPSVEVVKASCNLSGEGIPSTVIAPGLRNKEEAKRKVKKCVVTCLQIK